VIKSIWQNLIGAFNVVIFFSAMLIMAIVAVIAAFLVWLVPFKFWRRHGKRLLAVFPELWTDINTLLMHVSPPIRLTVEGDAALSKDRWYLVISNHASWLDILILSRVFNHKIPFLKFFMKKELLWTLPIAGFFCYMAGYPFMQRVTREDIRKNPALKNADVEMTKKACASLKDWPSTLMIFAEGTRFSKEKQQRQESPYQHLLKPKAGGMAMVLYEMQDKLSGIINATIHYDQENVGFWDFAKGNIRDIHVSYELLAINKELIGNYTEDRQFRRFIQQWLNEVWQRKDRDLNRHEQKESSHALS